jgi:hypothetical protein
MFEADDEKEFGEDRYPGMWLHCRRKKLLAALTDDPDEERRLIEVDVIVATPSEWEDSAERRYGGWNEVVMNGLVFAEKTIG